MGLNSGCVAPPNATALAATMCMCGPPCVPETLPVNEGFWDIFERFFGCYAVGSDFAFTEDQPAARSAQVVGRRG